MDDILLANLDNAAIIIALNWVLSVHKPSHSVQKPQVIAIVLIYLNRLHGGRGMRARVL